MKTKNTLIALGFVSLGVGVLVLPQHVGGYFTGEASATAHLSSELSNKKLVDDQKNLEGSLFGVTAKLANAVKETSLHLSLMGTAPSNKEDSSFAIILVNGKKQKLVSVGEDVVRGVTLYQVTNDYVLINRNGSIEKLSYSKVGDSNDDPNGSYFEASIAARHEENARPGSEVLNATSQNILQKGSLVHRQDSGSSGFANQMKTFVENRLINHYQSEYKKNPEETLSSFGVKSSDNGYVVGAGSPLLSANLKVGDVVKSVNDIPASQILNNPSAISKIRAAGVAIMQVERNGSQITVTYNF